MGLDGVEILMATEEKFGITISDEEAQNIQTVGDMHELVMRKVNLARNFSCLSQQAFHQLRRNAIACFGVNRREVKLDTELDEIVPRQDRQDEWVRFQKSVGATQWPELVRPREVVVLIVGMTVATIALLWWYAALVSNWGLSLSALVSLAGGIAIGGIVGLLTRPFKTTIPAGYRKAKEVAYFLVARNPQLLAANHSDWSKEAAWCSLREIIIEQTGVSEFNKNSRFVADLGID